MNRPNDFKVKNWTMAWWVECSSMARQTSVQSQVESNQRLKNLFLIPPCLTHYVSRVKGNNLEKGVMPSPTPLGVEVTEKRAFGCPRLLCLFKKLLFIDIALTLILLRCAVSFQKYCNIIIYMVKQKKLLTFF